MLGVGGGASVGGDINAQIKYFYAVSFTHTSFHLIKYTFYPRRKYPTNAI